MDILGHDELDVGQINGTTCKSVIIPLSDFLSWTGVNWWACDPPKTQTRRRQLLMSRKPISVAKSTINNVRRSLLSYNDVCREDFQPPGASDSELYESSYAGGWQYSGWFYEGL